MPRKASKGCKAASLNSDINEKPTVVSPKQGHITRVSGNRKRVAGICGFRLPKASGFSPVKFLRRLTSKLANALGLVSMRKRRKKPSPNKNPSSDLGRSRPFVTPVDSHRTEAIQDCIQFINSSSLQRSNSVCPSSS